MNTDESSRKGTSLTESWPKFFSPIILRAMPTRATFESFQEKLNRLVESFGKRLAELKQPGYSEAAMRDVIFANRNSSPYPFARS